MNSMKPARTITSHARKLQPPRQYTRFPYARVAKMWEQGRTISQIAHAIKRVDEQNPKDPHHSLRNFLHRMHKGYVDNKGRLVRLPYRVSPKLVRAGKQAGLRAWA